MNSLNHHPCTGMDNPRVHRVSANDPLSEPHVLALEAHRQGRSTVSRRATGGHGAKVAPRACCRRMSGGLPASSQRRSASSALIGAGAGACAAAMSSSPPRPR